MITLLLIYWQDAHSAQAIISITRRGTLLRLFAPQGQHRTMHRWGEINSPMPNLSPTWIYNSHISTLVTASLRQKTNKVKSRYLQKNVTSLQIESSM